MSDPTVYSRDDGTRVGFRGSNDVDPPTPDTDTDDGSKYFRPIVGMDGIRTTIDIYRILDAYGPLPSAICHAVKKLLCFSMGTRGHKDAATDLREAIVSLKALVTFLEQSEDQ